MSKLRQTVVNLLDELGMYSGCHRMPERSFFWKNHQFPVCARCTGVFIGQIFAILINFFANITYKISIICLSIMGLDWLIQELGLKMSTNYRRLFTGILGGFGLFNIYCIFAKNIIHIIRKRF